MSREPQYDQFQAALIEARQNYGLTQQEVASRIGKPQSHVSKYESGERRLDVVEFLGVCKVLGADPASILKKLGAGDKKKSILEIWEVSEDEFTEIIKQNPSLRGINLGYIAEKKVHDLFMSHPEVTESSKDDDHDRTKKGDRRIKYKNHEFILEVKSLQTKMCRHLGNDTWEGKSQVDGSDRRIVHFHDGSELNTTLLIRGEFDLLAVNCFAFGEKWRFVFAKNYDLPTSSFRKYQEEQRKQLIASLVSVSWPPKIPFTDNPFKLLDEMIQEREAEKMGQPLI